MDTLSCILLLLFTFTLLQGLRSLVARTTIARHNLPPGPVGLPMFGNLLQLGKKPHQSLARFANIHGPIMSFNLGQVATIVMSSAETAKGVLQINDQFLSNRRIPEAMKGARHDEYTLPFIPVSPRWRDLRKTCNMLFSNKNLDAGEELRRTKIKQLFNDINQNSLTGEAVDIGRLAFKTTIDLMLNTLFSEDFVHSADRAGEFKELLASILREVGRPNLADCFPVLRVVDPHGIKRRTGGYIWKLLNIFEGLVKKRVKLRSEGGYSTKNDILDVMLTDAEAEDKSPEIMYKDKIERLSVDLFVAGTDTITTTIEWAMAELLHNPKTMSKAKAELEQTVGKGNLVEESDIARLPYLQAIVKETFRLHPPVPLLLPRQAQLDLRMQGFTVPKSAQVMVNVWAIGRDPNLWENPSLFSPERFLGSKIDFKGRSFELTPFGAGRRICPGLPLAIRMLFLMLGLFINSFDWKLEGGIRPEDMDMDENFEITLKKAQPVQVVPLRASN